MIKDQLFLVNQNNEVPPHTSQKGIIKKSTNNKCSRGYREEGTLLHCWWSHYGKGVWRFLKKQKIKLLCDPAIPLQRIHPEKTRIKRYMHLNVHSSTILNSQDTEAT